MQCYKRKNQYSVKQEGLFCISVLKSDAPFKGTLPRFMRIVWGMDNYNGFIWEFFSPWQLHVTYGKHV